MIKKQHVCTEKRIIYLRFSRNYFVYISFCVCIYDIYLKHVLSFVFDRNIQSNLFEILWILCMDVCIQIIKYL